MTGARERGNIKGISNRLSAMDSGHFICERFSPQIKNKSDIILSDNVAYWLPQLDLNQ